MLSVYFVHSSAAAYIVYRMTLNLNRIFVLVFEFSLPVLKVSIIVLFPTAESFGGLEYVEMCVDVKNLIFVFC